MRRNVTGRWFGSLLMMAALACGGLRVSQADEAVSTPSAPAAAPATMAETVSDGLSKILMGGAPGGVADLKAMQQRVQKLSEKLMLATVGVQVGQAQGSGVIVSKDGYVLTAAHVSGKPGRDVTFLMSDGKILKGKTLGLNRTLDAGLMKITEGSDFPSAEMGLSDILKDGQWCLATGHPGGYQSDRKPVLRLGRVLLSDNSTITTDCTLVGGDSGGPLFDFDGKVIGINSRISGPISSNMHVPVNTFKETWDRMVKGDAWGHLPGNDPYMGVKGDPAAKEAKIGLVYPDSPAAKAGIAVGDMIASVNDVAVADYAAFKAIINDHQPGDELKLKIKRGDQEVEIKLKLAKRW
ncbi:MAG: trypsin-like peptidase domain-containing protein [Pirellulaceae bacterium]|nr:trypsin-like peptidase domain-containing protein [Pirellulaceae bacterium]